MDEGEVTMICIDNFEWMKGPKELCLFHDQIDAAEIYCERKLEAHPNNLVGLVIFGTVVSKVALYPTRDVGLIRDRLASLGTSWHYPNIIKGIELCRAGWDRHQHIKNKRVVVFAGGPLFQAPPAEALNLFKESRAVVDVVNFGYQIKDDGVYGGDEHLKALVDAVNNDSNKENGNSRYFCINQVDGFSLSHHISTSLIPSLVAEEEEAQLMSRKAQLYHPPSLAAQKEEQLPPWWEVEEGLVDLSLLDFSQ